MSGWQTKQLGEVLQLNYGKGFSVENHSPGSIPVYESNGIVGFHNSALAQGPGVIDDRKVSTVEVHLCSGASYPKDTTYYITPQDAPGADTGSPYYLLRHLILKCIRSDVDIPGLNREMACFEPVSLHSGIPEQKAIAHSLSTVQRAIDAQERMIQTTTGLKKALMQKLFTEGLRGEPQKETEIGLVPEGWGVMELADITQMERGKFSHLPRNDPRFYGGEHPLVQTGDVSNCDGHIRSYMQSLNDAGLAISKMFPAGSILITIAANFGFTGILEYDAACPDSLTGIRSSEHINSEFLNHYLSTQQEIMNRLAPKGTQKYIILQFLRIWPSPVSPLEDQRLNAIDLLTIDHKIRYAELKSSLLQQLFRFCMGGLISSELHFTSSD
jgi:type I restriction enzyme S subunit